MRRDERAPQLVVGGALRAGDGDAANPLVRLEVRCGPYETLEARHARWGADYERRKAARTAAFYERREREPRRHAFSRTVSGHFQAIIVDDPDEAVPVGQPLDLDAQRAHMFFAGAPPQPQAMDRRKVQRFVSRRTMAHDLGVEREARREAARGGGGGVPRQDSSYCKTCFAAIAAALVALDLTRREGVIATGVLAAMQAAGGSGAAATVNATAAAATAAELL